MSAHQNKHVVIFKSISESENLEKDNYYKIISSAGFELTYIPVLEFEFINLDQLLNKIKNPNNYAGIIFSSPRSVSGLELSINDQSCRKILNEWKNHKNYVVGEKTGAKAEKLGLTVYGKGTGNSDALSSVICQSTYEKPFLYPTGSLTSKNFEEKLKESNIEVDNILIYKTKPHHSLENNISKLKSLKFNKEFYFIYFSPSGLEFSVPILNKLNFDWNNIKLISIGPSTKAAILRAGLKVAGMSAKPDPEQLAEVLLSVGMQEKIL